MWPQRFILGVTPLSYRIYCINILYENDSPPDENRLNSSPYSWIQIAFQARNW